MPNAPRRTEDETVETAGNGARAAEACRARKEPAGTLLAEALAALAIVGLVAVAAAGLAAAALRATRAADDLGAARRAAATVLARAGAVSWARLPAALGGGGDDRELRVDSTSSPDHELLVGLPRGLAEGTVELVAEGLGPGGASARFREAVAVRCRARVAWRGRDGARRRLEFVDVRY